MVKSSTDVHRVHLEKWWINTIYRILQSHYEKRSVQINWPPCWKKRHSLWVHERNSNKIMHSHFYLCALNVNLQIRIRFVRTDLVTENRHEMNELCLWIFASGEEKKVKSIENDLMKRRPWHCIQPNEMLSQNRIKRRKKLLLTKKTTTTTTNFFMNWMFLFSCLIRISIRKQKQKQKLRECR